LSKPKLNTLIDGNKAVVRGDWLENIGVKSTPVRDLDEVEAYLADEASARLLDPPGSARAVAKATRKAHSMAVGLSHSGLTLKALCEIVAPLCPRPGNSGPMASSTVERVIRGLLRLDSILTDERLP
jgi:hypothetical protein